MYIEKIFKVLSNEGWRIFLVGWVRVVLFKQKFTSQKYKDLTFVFPDPLVFLWQFKEIFIDECYDIPCMEKPKLLVDCGANIGMCSLYWAKKFPYSKIVAVEADPKVAEMLQANLELNDIKNVLIVKKAAWLHDGQIEFHLGPIDGGAIGKGMPTASSNTSTIECFNFSKWLSELSKVDYLKIDIEGAEVEVVQSISADTFKKISRIFVEYHQPRAEVSTIGKIICTLERAGFSCFVSKVILAPKNLNFSKTGVNPFLAQCNIHGERVD